MNTAQAPQAAATNASIRRDDGYEKSLQSSDLQHFRTIHAVIDSIYISNNT
ncbi:hypothetical protein GGR74_002594 [Xanthomonas arboricola]